MPNLSPKGLSEPAEVAAEDSRPAQDDSAASTRPPREIVAGWLDEWREYWGALANGYCAQGVPWPDAERRAAVEAEAEMMAAGFGPPPVMDPDPQTALWRDLLTDMIANGEAARHLSPEELRHASSLLEDRPLDGDALRAVVHRVGTSEVNGQLRAAGIPGPEETQRWACLNSYCIRKDRWWMSTYGVVNCVNCRPPAFPWLVVAEGEADDAPFIESDRSNQAVVKDAAS